MKNMSVRPRVIPTLLIDEGDLVKTKGFRNPNYLGDPINAIKIFNEKGVDELCILDITASRNRCVPDMNLLKKMATEAFMPLSYGGGINSIDQVKEIFYIGFEKIIINTALVNNPGLVQEVVSYFGTQSIVASIDYKRKWGRDWCYVMDGTQRTEYSPLDLATKAEQMGVGEILLYNIERDGMRRGYDLKTIFAITKKIDIPLIACGGARNIEDFRRALDAGAHAVAAGSIFVYFGKKNAVLINYPEESELTEKGIYMED